MRAKTGTVTRISKALLALLALAPAAALSSGCPAQQREDQRQIVVKARGQGEAYDALQAVLVQRYDNVDPEGTDRSRGEVVTAWRRTDEPNRLVRTRARGKVLPGPEDGERTVEVQVERQLSSAKTDTGDLDRQRPAWVGGADTADVTQEREILLAVRERLSGKAGGR